MWICIAPCWNISRWVDTCTADRRLTVWMYGRRRCMRVDRSSRPRCTGNYSTSPDVQQSSQSGAFPSSQVSPSSSSPWQTLAHSLWDFPDVDEFRTFRQLLLNKCWGAVWCRYCQLSDCRLFNVQRFAVCFDGFLTWIRRRIWNSWLCLQTWDVRKGEGDGGMGVLSPMAAW